MPLSCRVWFRVISGSAIVYFCDGLGSGLYPDARLFRRYKVSTRPLTEHIALLATGYRLWINLFRDNEASSNLLTFANHTIIVGRDFGLSIFASVLALSCLALIHHLFR